jgi:hypothetical protein
MEEGKAIVELKMWKWGIRVSKIIREQALFLSY